VSPELGLTKTWANQILEGSSVGRESLNKKTNIYDME
jgi:hypothetical protein